jgi:hypothetical protein
MPQNTNLNVTPYYDDFDKFKNFYKVLYRPGFPIQARELTTMQSILQNQIENMGNHFFKDGSMVIPGQVGFDNNVDCILLQSSFLGSEVELYRSQLTGTTITGITTGVKAKVLYSISAEESDRNFITLYVKYTEAGGTNNDILRFLDNEQLLADKEITFGGTLLEIGSPFAQMIPNEATAVASVAYVNTGVYFIRGHFVDVKSQYIILDQYAKDPSFRVGLEVSESIITPEDDDSLNDNAAGSSNYAAPGAHRFKINTTLIKKEIGDDADKNFIELIRIENGKVQSFVERTAYSELEKELAKRTFDTNGDFMIDPFDITVRECLNDGFNDGVYNAGEITEDTKVEASESLYAVQVSPGRAYLRGYPIQSTNPKYLDVPKPRNFVSLQNNIVPFELGNYVLVSNVYGTPLITGPNISPSYQIVELKDRENTTPGSSNGTTIGFARISNWELEDTSDGVTGNENDVYKAFLFDVSLFTRIKLGASTTIIAGSQIVGKSSGATGFIRVSGGALSVTSDNLELINVNGNFREGEVISVDGRDVGTVSKIYNYQFSDVRQFIGRDSSNAVAFSCDIMFNDSFQLSGTRFTYDSGDDVLIGFNSNIALEVRPYDRLYFAPGNYFSVAVLPSNYDLSTVFDYDTQSISVTVETDAGFDVVTPTDGQQFTSIFRFRPKIEDTQLDDLFIELPKEAIQSISDESFILRRTFDAQTTSNSFTISLPETQQFSAVDSRAYTLVVTGVSVGSSYTIGEILTLQTTNSSNAAYTTFNTSGVPRTTITVGNLVGITAVRLNASISKNAVFQKVKNATKMSVWRVSRSSNQSDQVPFGLAYSPLYGTRIEDKDISLGVTDAYKLHAVYESIDNNEAIIPYVTLVESAFFATGSIVTGRTSGAKALVVDFNSSSLRLSIVYQTDQKFIQNEIVTGVNSLGNNIQGLISDAEGSINLGSKNITSSFYLESGQTNHYYGISKLVRKKGAAAPIRKLKVVVDFFSHEATGDYFNINSYVGIDYKEIPIYTYSVGSITNKKPLSDVLDFRPAVKQLVDGAGSVSNPYYLQCSSLDFVSREFQGANSTVFDLPKPDSDFRLDYSHYVKRIDKVFVDQLGKFFTILGTPAENPIPPEDRDDALLLAIIGHNAYGFNPKVDSLVFQEDIKRYTMRDITSLEKRVHNIEYYSVLTLLEQDTNSLVIKDEFGNDKFKNGFLVDSFENQNVADLDNPDYSASMDFNSRTLRASHYTTNVSLIPNETSSSNVTRNVGIITLPYQREALIIQPYASLVENVNPFNVFSFIGVLTLNPSSDDWVDTDVAPVNVVQVEGNFQSQARLINADQNGFGAISWGSWQEDWSGARTTVSGGEWRGWLGPLGRNIPGFGTRTTTTTGILERRTGTQQRVVATFEQRSLGSRVINKQNIPFIRSRNISIVAEKLKPLTRYYSFFDNVAVSSYTTPKLIELIKDPAEDSRTNNIPFQIGETVEGYRLVSGTTRRDGSAIFSAKVVAPNDGLRSNPYTDGELPEVYSSQTQYLNIDTNKLAEQVSGQYYGQIEIGIILVGKTSSATAIVRDKRIITDRTGTFKGSFFIPNASVTTNPRWATGRRLFRLTVSSTDSRALPGSTDSSSAQTNYDASGVLETLQETILSIRNAEIVTDQLNEQRTTTRTRQEQVQIGYWDPLAQSFMIEERGGVYLDSVDLFFAKKDQNIPISVQIREMEYGVPCNRILPLSTAVLAPDQVEVSENASIPTTFKFPAPVYISETQEYAIVLFTDSNEYEVWISEMGQVDITGDRTISEQPYAGVLFKSQNASTWSPNQLQDLKFTLYRAKFGPLSGKLVLNNAELNIGNRGILKLRENPIVTYKPNQVITLNDASAQFTLGARIYQDTSNASATIVSVDTVSSPNKITITDIEGSFLQGTDVGGNVVYPIISSQATATLNVSTTAGVLTGNFTVGKLITGQTSGAKAYVTSWNVSTGVLEVNYVSKEFDDGETISQTNPSVSTIVNTSTYSGDSLQKFPSTTTTYPESSKKITILHSNHGMHDTTNNVAITGIISEIPSTTLRQAISATDTSITVADAGAFHKKIGGFTYGEDNPGYIKIDDEIIAYTNISTDGFTITVKTTAGRGAGGTTAAAHEIGSAVECYNLDGIPLTQINKVHTSIINPTLDSYDVTVASVATVGISSGGIFATASQNVPFEVLTPNINNVVLPGTQIYARINRVSGTSIGAIEQEPSFVNTNSYENVTLNDANILANQSLILSKINEDAKLSGEKSFTMELILESETDTLSPVIDLDRCSIITTSNRINNPDNWDLARLPEGDPHDAVYITRMISLDNQVSRSLRVMFDAYRPNDTNIRVLYRVVPVGFTGDENSLLWEFFNTDGGPDRPVTPVNDLVFKAYEYNKSGLEFTKFQIKVVLSSPNQALVPQIKYFRSIATAV